MSANVSARPALGSVELRVGGLARLSTCDWPGELVATVFCQGCPWACAYCHNPHLLPASGQDQIEWREVLSFLESRRGLLDGVVFSGGEPTLQADLSQAMGAVRALGFRIGLHSAGPYPERLGTVLSLVDWIGFDVKAPFDEYDRITGVRGSGAKARDSLCRILASDVTCEVRTTVHDLLLDEAALARLASDLSMLGVERHKMQAFRSTGCTTPWLIETHGRDLN